MYNKPSVVGHICNPSYFRGRDELGEFRFKASPGKQLIRSHPKQQIRCGGMHL